MTAVRLASPPPVVNVPPASSEPYPNRSPNRFTSRFSTSTPTGECDRDPSCGLKALTRVSARMLAKLGAGLNRPKYDGCVVWTWKRVRRSTTCDITLSSGCSSAKSKSPSRRLSTSVLSEPDTGRSRMVSRWRSTTASRCFHNSARSLPSGNSKRRDVQSPPSDSTRRERQPPKATLPRPGTVSCRDVESLTGTLLEKMRLSQRQEDINIGPAQPVIHSRDHGSRRGVKMRDIVRINALNQGDAPLHLPSRQRPP